ncbi:MAG: AMP-binding protein [Vicinamibacterales bacterium]
MSWLAKLQPATPTLRHVIVVGDPGETFVSLASLENGPAVPPADVRSSDVALMQLSGGSTGLSKLIPRTHDDYIYSFRASNDICGITEDSVYLCVLPAAHNFPMSSPAPSASCMPEEPWCSARHLLPMSHFRSFSASV